MIPNDIRVPPEPPPLAVLVTLRPDLAPEEATKFLADLQAELERRGIRARLYRKSDGPRVEGREKREDD